LETQLAAGHAAATTLLAAAVGELVGGE